MFAFSIEMIVAVIIAYLFGSISSAIITCKIMGLPDPRSEGSRNPGATNVLRIGGKKAAAVTMIGDVLKGVIPVLLAKWLGLSPLGIALTAFAAFLGHLYPIFFGFVGGKGVATLIGGIFVISWPTGICFLLTWLIITLLLRYVSLASMSAAALTPLYLWFFTHDLAYVIVALLMALMVIYRHRSNIINLRNGTENKIGFSKK